MLNICVRSTETHALVPHWLAMNAHTSAAKKRTQIASVHRRLRRFAPLLLFVWLFNFSGAALAFYNVVPKNVGAGTPNDVAIAQACDVAGSLPAPLDAEVLDADTVAIEKSRADSLLPADHAAPCLVVRIPPQQTQLSRAPGAVPFHHCTSSAVLVFGRLRL